MLLLNKWPYRLLLLQKSKNDSGSVFSRTFDSGFEREMQNPAEVERRRIHGYLWTLLAEMTGITFSDSDSAHVRKCLNLGPEIFQI